MTAHVLRCGDFVRLGGQWFNRNHVTWVGKPKYLVVHRAPPDPSLPDPPCFTDVKIRCDGELFCARMIGTEADGVEAHRQFVYEVIGHLEPAADHVIPP